MGWRGGDTPELCIADILHMKTVNTDSFYLEYLVKTVDTDYFPPHKLAIYRVAYPSCHPPKKQESQTWGEEKNRVQELPPCLGLCFFLGWQEG